MCRTLQTFIAHRNHSPASPFHPMVFEGGAQQLILDGIPICQVSLLSLVLGQRGYQLYPVPNAEGQFSYEARDRPSEDEIMAISRQLMLRSLMEQIASATFRRSGFHTHGPSTGFGSAEPNAQFYADSDGLGTEQGMPFVVINLDDLGTTPGAPFYTAPDGLGAEQGMPFVLIDLDGPMSDIPFHADLGDLSAEPGTRFHVDLGAQQAGPKHRGFPWSLMDLAADLLRRGRSDTWTPHPRSEYPASTEVVTREA